MQPLTNNPDFRLAPSLIAMCHRYRAGSSGCDSFFRCISGRWRENKDWGFGEFLGYRFFCCVRYWKAACLVSGSAPIVAMEFDR